MKTYFVAGVPYSDKSLNHMGISDFEWDKGNALMHYGIKGQHWGKRRFVDYNGELTAEGRRRYGIEEFQPAGPQTGPYAASKGGNRMRDVAGGVAATQQRNAKIEASRNQGRNMATTNKQSILSDNGYTQLRTNPRLQAQNASTNKQINAGGYDPDLASQQASRQTSRQAQEDQERYNNSLPGKINNAVSSATDYLSKTGVGNYFTGAADRAAFESEYAAQDAKDMQAWKEWRSQQDAARALQQDYARRAAEAAANGDTEAQQHWQNEADNVYIENDFKPVNNPADYPTQTGFQRDVNNVGNWLGTAANNVGKWFGTAANNVGKAVTNVGNWMGDNLGIYNAANWVGDRASDVGNWLTGNRDASQYERYAQQYQPNSQMYNEYMQAAQDARSSSPFGRIGNAVTNVGNWMGDNLGIYNAANWVGDRARDAGDWVGDRATDAWNGVRSGWRQLTGDPVGYEMDAQRREQAGDYAGAQAARAAAKQAWENSTINRVGDWFGDRGRDVGNWVANAPSNVSQFAGDVFNQQGLKDNWAATQADINNKYDSMILRARRSGASDADIQRINMKRYTELSAPYAEYQRRLNASNAIVQPAQNVSNWFTNGWNNITGQNAPQGDIGIGNAPQQSTKPYPANNPIYNSMTKNGWAGYGDDSAQNANEYFDPDKKNVKYR